MNKQDVFDKLKEIGLAVIDKSELGEVPELMRSIAEDIYNYNVSDIYVDLSSVQDISVRHGVIITYKNQEENDGVYIFMIQNDSSISLMVVIPSTISTGPMIRRASGDITNAITGLDLPSMTVFDRVEVAGHVIADTIITPMMDAMNIPQNKRTQFATIYLPRFMANVAQQYIGSSTLKEEIVEMEPHMVKNMVLKENDEDVQTEDD